MQMKYIIADGVPVVFPAMLTHRYIANGARRHPVTSAGFVDFKSGGTAFVSGWSESLNIGPAEGDAKRIEMFYKWGES